MKKRLLTTCIIFSLFSVVYGQKVVKDSAGNFRPVISNRAKADSVKVSDYIDSNGVSFPAFQRKGSTAIYIWRVSKKTGKHYKQYLKIEN